MGLAAPNELPTVLWPVGDELPSGSHVWLVGGALGDAARCALVAADHAVPLVRHEVVGQPRSVEHLAAAGTVIEGRQYQLRIISSGRTNILGVWTVTDPLAAPQLTRCTMSSAGTVVLVDLAIAGTAIVHVLGDSGGGAVEVVTGDAVIAVPPTGLLIVRVLAVDGRLVDERVLEER